MIGPEPDADALIEHEIQPNVVAALVSNQRPRPVDSVERKASGRSSASRTRSLPSVVLCLRVLRRRPSIIKGRESLRWRRSFYYSRCVAYSSVTPKYDIAS